MRDIGALAWSVVRDAIRRKVIWAVVIFSALLSLVAPSLPSYGVGVVGAVFREVSFVLMLLAGAVVALALAATRIPQEVERRIVFTILSRDVPRGRYIAGTWLGVFAVIGLVLVAFTVVAIVVGYFVYGTVMIRLFESAFAVWLETGIVAAVAMAMSTRFGAVTSIVTALAFEFIGHNTTSLFSATVSPSLIPSLDSFDVVNAVSHGSGYSVAYAGAMSLVFVAWVAVVLGLGALLFGSRDL